MNIFKILACVVACSTLVACGPNGEMRTPVVAPKVTQANLNRIMDDMSPATVESIIGAPSESKSSEIPIVGGTQTTSFYREGDSTIKIVYKNDRVKEKEGNFAAGAARP